MSTSTALDLVTEFDVRRIHRGVSEEVTERLAAERTISLTVNGQHLFAIQCLPEMLEELVVGFLFTEGLLSRLDQIGDLRVDAQSAVVRIDVSVDIAADAVEKFRAGLRAGSGCGRGVFSGKPFGFLDCRRKIDHGFRVQSMPLLEVIRDFERSSTLFQQTGAVHSAAVAEVAADRCVILTIAEDIGRHNAVDKVVGASLKKDIPLDDKLLLSSGRLTLEIATKAARANFPLLASPSAPTDAAVRLADDVDLTLVGFARARRMNIYCAGWRIV
jgi:FdhD protein